MSMNYHTSKHVNKKSQLVILNEIKSVEHNGRIYKLLEVLTRDAQKYICIRLYNQNNHFIKQFLMEKEVAEKLGLIRIINWRNTRDLDYEYKGNNNI